MKGVLEGRGRGTGRGSAGGLWTLCLMFVERGVLMVAIFGFDGDAATCPHVAFLTGLAGQGWRG